MAEAIALSVVYLSLSVSLFIKYGRKKGGKKFKKATSTTSWQ